MLTAEQREYIRHAGIGDAIVTGKQVEEIKNELGLGDMNRGELQEVRAQVVILLANESNIEREAHNWGRYDELRNNMSGITAVIDSLIFT